MSVFVNVIGRNLTYRQPALHPHAAHHASEVGSSSSYRSSLNAHTHTRPLHSRSWMPAQPRVSVPRCRARAAPCTAHTMAHTTTHTEHIFTYTRAHHRVIGKRGNRRDISGSTYDRHTCACSSMYIHGHGRVRRGVQMTLPPCAYSSRDCVRLPHAIPIVLATDAARISVVSPPCPSRHGGDHQRGGPSPQTRIGIAPGIAPIGMPRCPIRAAACWRSAARVW